MVTVTLGVEKSVRDSESNGPMTANLNKDNKWMIIVVH